jgi:glyoxalase-like protein
MMPVPWWHAKIVRLTTAWERNEKLMVSVDKAEVDHQLPQGEEIFLDHVGHFVADREAASHALARCGFAPTPVSIQVNPDGTPTGTGNVCAMFARGYIEVLFKTAATPLAAELDISMARYPGVHLAAFAVAHAAKALARLGAAGFALRPLVHFQRPVDTEAGPATAAFTVARVERGAMAEGRIQILTHHTEDAVWQRRWLVHRNGARGLTSAVIVVADVAEAAARFERFTARPALTINAGAVVALDRGRVELVSRAAFDAALPEITVAGLPFIGAYGIAVASLDATEALLSRAGLRTRRAGDCLVAPFPEELGRGAWLFAETNDAGLFR